MSEEVANTKAIALPLLIIIALVLAGLITRQTLARAMASMKGDLRLTLLFTSGVVCTLLSFFILTSAAWAYAIGSALIGYTYCLACAPGMLTKFADRLLLVGGGWFLILIGIPDNVSSGIIGTISVATCNSYFAEKPAMCKEGYLTFATIVTILIIVMNFFAMVALVSAVFEGDATTLTSELPQNIALPIPSHSNTASGYTSVQDDKTE
jgi:hypothetical protein